MHLQVRLTAETIEIISKVHKFFKDAKKTQTWLTTKNPHFGGISPLYLINVGRAHKVIQFIDAAADEGGWDAES